MLGVGRFKAKNLEADIVVIERVQSPKQNYYQKLNVDVKVPR